MRRKRKAESADTCQKRAGGLVERESERERGREIGKGKTKGEKIKQSGPERTDKELERRAREIDMGRESEVRGWGEGGDARKTWASGRGSGVLARGRRGSAGCLGGGASRG